MPGLRRGGAGSAGFAGWASGSGIPRAVPGASSLRFANGEGVNPPRPRGFANSPRDFLANPSPLRYTLGLLFGPTPLAGPFLAVQMGWTALVHKELR
jgi:hypothetical protein